MLIDNVVAIWCVLKVSLVCCMNLPHDDSRNGSDIGPGGLFKELIRIGSDCRGRLCIDALKFIVELLGESLVPSISKEHVELSVQDVSWKHSGMGAYKVIAGSEVVG